jgi:hypothetical protein
MKSLIREEKKETNEYMKSRIERDAGTHFTVNASRTS